MKIPGIYKIYSNLDNSKFYIGSSVNIKSRKDLHFFLLRNNKHDSKYMQRYYNKHGNVFTFEILEECSKENLLKREQYYLDLLKPCFNSRIIAESNYGLKHSDVTKYKISQGNKGKVHTEETKEIIRNKNKNFKPSLEMNVKNSESHKQFFKENGSKKLSYENVCKIKELFNTKTKLKDVALLFNVSISTIKAIKYKRNWNH